MFALFTSFGGALSAYITMVTGGLVWVLAGRLFLDFVAPYTLAVATEAIVYPVTAIFEQTSLPAERV